MTEADRIAEWVRFFQASPPGYSVHALEAVLKADGEKMLQAVLKALKIHTPAELVVLCARNRTS